MAGKSIAAGVRQQVIGSGYPVFSWYSIMAGMGIFPDPHEPAGADFSRRHAISMAEIDNLLDRSAANYPDHRHALAAHRAPPDRPLLADLFLVERCPAPI